MRPITKDDIRQYLDSIVGTDNPDAYMILAVLEGLLAFVDGKDDV